MSSHINDSQTFKEKEEYIMESENGVYKEIYKPYLCIYEVILLSYW